MARILAVLALLIFPMGASAESCRFLESTLPSPALIIVFEGFGQFDAKAVRMIEDYQSGKSAELPEMKGWGALMTAGLVGPMVQRYGASVAVKILDSGATQQGIQCAQDWLKIPGKREVIMTGHSLGGPAASQAAKALADRGVQLQSVMTIDAFGGSISRDGTNVQFWGNYYQRGGGLPGASLDSADHNVQIETTHMKIPQSEIVHADFFGRIDSILRN